MPEFDKINKPQLKILLRNPGLQDLHIGIAVNCRYNKE